MSILLHVVIAPSPERRTPLISVARAAKSLRQANSGTKIRQTEYEATVLTIQNLNLPWILACLGVIAYMW
jgi:hypothetical protein